MRVPLNESNPNNPNNESTHMFCISIDVKAHDNPNNPNNPYNPYNPNNPNSPNKIGQPLVRRYTPY